MRRRPTEMVAGIVVAAGRGERFGAPKQFLTLGGVPLLDHAVARARAACDVLVLVLPAGADWDADREGRADVSVVAGGASRSDSVRAGLAAVPAGSEIVVVHDAARPLASSELFTAVIDAVRAGADAAVPGLAVADTIKRVDGANVVETVDRDELVAVQTPQAFRVDVLRAAHGALGDATDDAALVEAAGGRVVVVPGDRRNVKVTEPSDLALAEALLAEQAS
jgi:2-C-methyl-D-erythritol 4-phosphate cytidylyltransferase